MKVYLLEEFDIDSNYVLAVYKNKIDAEHAKARLEWPEHRECHINASWYIDEVELIE